jgi:filamentous hemagglutinin family protein
MKQHVKGIRHLLKTISTLASVLMGGLLFASSVSANPVINNVSAGSASVSQTANTTTVNQTTQQAVINWHSFNIGNGETTHFQQPSGGVALNRIDPSQGASQIYGTLTSTGRIILENGSGIHFGPNAYVNVGGMIATTMDMSDSDFMSGNYHFSQVPGFNGEIINEGHLIAASHGLIALVGGAVTNNGLIEAHLGQVILRCLLLVMT